MIKTFEKIQIKFEERFWFSNYVLGRDLLEIVLCLWRNAPSDIVAVTSLSDLNIENVQHKYDTAHVVDYYTRVVPKYKFKSHKDNGEFVGEYTPSYDCPEGDSLLLKIGLNIKVKTTWKGYISFQHSLGAEKITAIRQRIIFKNQQDRHS